MINKARLHDLHAIRGWAALFVVIAHAKYPFWSGGTDYIKEHPIDGWKWSDYVIFGLDMSTSAASVYVIIFFVLSGFFIARSLLGNEMTPFVFYGNRLIRIYIPVLGSMLVGWTCVTCAVAINPELFFLKEGMRPYNIFIISVFDELRLRSFLNTLIFNPTGDSSFFAGNYPYWSLFYEMIFYITIPWLTKRITFILIAAVLHVVSWFIYYQWLSLISYSAYAIYFAAGFFVYQIIHLHTNPRLIPEIIKLTNILIIGSFVFLLLALGAGLAKYNYLSYDLAMFSGVCFVFWILIGENSALFRLVYPLIVNRPSRFLGKISFSLYLIHVPVLLLLYSLANLLTGKLAYYQRWYWLAVMVTLPIAYLAFIFLEKPSLMLLNKYNTRYLQK